jgi:hypothetical protein
VFSTPGNDDKEKKRRYEPGNIATGLAVGTKSIIKGVVSGLAGVVIEPIKGAKHEGFKGATLGLGRGILGLVCKPVAGTLDLLSYSVRGVNNMPTSLYKKILLYFRKRKARIAKKKAEEERFANLQDLAPVAGEVDLLPALSNEPLQDMSGVEEAISLSNLRASEIDTANLVISPNMMLQTLIERNQKLYSLYVHISNRISELDAHSFSIIDIELYTPSSYNYEDPDEIHMETYKVNKSGEKLREGLMHVASIYKEKETPDGSKPSQEEIISFIISCGRDIGIDILDEDLHNIVSSLNSSFNADMVRKLSSPVHKRTKKVRKSKKKSRRKRYSIPDERVVKEVMNTLNQEPEEILDEDEVIIEEIIEEIVEEEVPLNPYLVKAAEWKPLPLKDDHRHPALSNDKGGIALTDKKIMNTLRDAAKELIKTLGRKILKGDFNLTTVSFPIKCMQPRTVLHNSLRAFMLNPLYVNRAAIIDNPIERIKLVVASTIGSFHTSSTFLKPVLSK